MRDRDYHPASRQRGRRARRGGYRALGDPLRRVGDRAVGDRGVCRVIAELCRLAEDDLFAEFDHADIVARLVALGAVDGRISAASHSKDDVGLALIHELRALVA